MLCVLQGYFVGYHNLVESSLGRHPVGYLIGMNLVELQHYWSNVINCFGVVISFSYSCSHLN